MLFLSVNWDGNIVEFGSLIVFVEICKHMVISEKFWFLGHSHMFHFLTNFLASIHRFGKLRPYLIEIS